MYQRAKRLISRPTKPTQRATIRRRRCEPPQTSTTSLRLAWQADDTVADVISGRTHSRFLHRVPSRRTMRHGHENPTVETPSPAIRKAFGRADACAESGGESARRCSRAALSESGRQHVGGASAARCGERWIQRRVRIKSLRSNPQGRRRRTPCTASLDYRHDVDVADGGPRRPPCESFASTLCGLSAPSPPTASGPAVAFPASVRRSADLAGSVPAVATWPGPCRR